MPSFSSPGQPFFPGGSNPLAARRHMAERRSSVLHPSCCMWNAIGDFWWVKRWLCRWFLQDVAVVEHVEFHEFPADSDSPMTEGTKWPSLQPARTKAPPEGTHPKIDRSDPGGRRKRGPFHGEFFAGHTAGWWQVIQMVPFCSSLKTNHQSAGQVNSIKFLENAKSFYQTSGFASEVLDGKVARNGFVWKCCVPLHPMVLLIIVPTIHGYFIGGINPTFSDKPKSFSQSLPFQGEFPVWDQFFTSQQSPAPSVKAEILDASHWIKLQSWCLWLTSEFMTCCKCILCIICIICICTSCIYIYIYIYIYTYNVYWGGPTQGVQKTMPFPLLEAGMLQQELLECEGAVRLWSRH